ncbi:hypothetical protein [Planococcus sp. CAU13]|uniref:hypothetical protein n=1 Tax=Planococcus sp. CAU13 TaxID=1541197 RepID=UPI00052FF39F|nr:hypothetical protein [Planococcus sp. CAU13]
MKVLYEGTITNQVLRKKLPLRMKRLYLEDLPAIEAVQEAVIADLREKTALHPLSTEEFLFILNERGLMVGAYAEEELIGFRALLIPEIDEEHLGYDIGLPESELHRVIYQEISAVLPAFRGNRLQQKLADVIMKELPKLPGNFRYVCCTVAPMNIPSLKDKFTQDMHIAALTEKYGSKERYVCVKDLENPSISYSESAAAKLDDFSKQHQLFDAGYVGVNFQMRNGFHEIQFVKPIL